MSRRFQCKAVPSIWFELEDYRLNAKPYFSGAIEAKKALENFRCEQLSHLAKKGKRGIFNGPRFGRVYVDDPNRGVKLLSGADILQSDMSNADAIASWQARDMPEMILQEGTTLISSYGTIGRCVYTREDMAGMMGSDNVLKVIPDKAKILPGYLFAFISCRFGTPLVIKGEGGSVITYLDPSRMYTLPIPRLGEVEVKAHELVQRASELRVQASKVLLQTVKELENEIAGAEVSWRHRKPQAFSVGVRNVNGFLSRLDAFHHIGFVGEAFEKARVPLVEISNYADALYPPFMKRIRVEEGGIEFLGGADTLTLDQRSQSRIATKTPDIDQFIVKSGYVLFQCDGQRYGIFGRPVLANRNIIGKAVTQHMMRIIPHDERDAGFIYAYLATEFGRRFLMRFSAGTSIPSLNEDGARKILIYWPTHERRHVISQIAEQAWENRASATELEDEARHLIERTIQEGIG